MYPIAIVSVNKKKYSETFIHNHVKLLPAKVHYLHEGHLPQAYSDGIDGESHAFLQPEAEPTFWEKLFGKPTDARSEEEKLQDAIVAYLQKHEIRVVLAEYGAAGVKMMDVCERAGVPMVVHFHGYDAYHKGEIEFYGKDYPKMFEKAAAVIGVSKHMCNRLLELGLPKEKLRYNPYGPDASLFHYADAGKAPQELLAVGRFAETKSPHLTILAFSKVLAKHPQSKLRIGGDGHLKEACQLLVRALKIEESVEFLGILSHEEVGKWMRKSRALVQHSITTPSNDTEGTPVVIIEACAAGLPIIATRHAGIPDVVLENETGWLVDEGDLDGMTQYMIRILEEPQLATQMGKAGHERVKEHFTLTKHIQTLWNILELVIHSTKPA